MTTTTHAGGEFVAAADAGAATIRVWDLPTRVFHWTLALSFAGAFITAESERWRDVHVMLGYTVLGLTGFRLVWGLVGSRYARFAAFVVGPGRVKTYLASLLAGRPEHHVGHNPAGAVAIVALLGLALVVGGSGLATYNDIGGEWLEEVHEAAANAMLAVVALHIAGVIVSSLLHRENLVLAMLSGKKRGAPQAGIERSYRGLGMALLIAVVAAWVAWAADGGGQVAARDAERPGMTQGASGDKAKARRLRDDD